MKRRKFFTLILGLSFIFSLPQLASAWFDNFNDGKADGWTENFQGGNGKWTVENGVYCVSEATANCGTVAGDKSWQNYTIEVKGKVVGDSDPNYHQLQVIARWQDKQNFYSFSYHAVKGSQWWSWIGGNVTKETPENDKKLTKVGEWYKLKIVADGTRLSAYVNDELMETLKGVKLKNGMIGVDTYACHSCYDDVWVYGEGIPYSPGEPGAVEPEGKLTITWGILKSRLLQ